MKSLIHRSTILVAVLGVGSALGCTTPVERHWGDAVRTNRTLMIQNPEAGGPKPVLGLDPLTGELVIERYEREQLAEPESQQEIFLITQ